MLNLMYGKALLTVLKFWSYDRLKLTELIPVEVSSIKYSGDQRLSPDAPFSRKRLTAPILGSSIVSQTLTLGYPELFQIIPIVRILLQTLAVRYTLR